MDKLRLDPEPGTTEGFSREGALTVYSSSLLRDGDERLLTIQMVAGEGIRLTDEQVLELRDYLMEHLAQPGGKFSSICRCGHHSSEHTIIDKHASCDECAHEGCGCKNFWPINCPAAAGPDL